MNYDERPCAVGNATNSIIHTLERENVIIKGSMDREDLFIEISNIIDSYFGFAVNVLDHLSEREIFENDTEEE